MFFKDLDRTIAKLLTPGNALKKLIVLASIPLIPVVFVFFVFLKDDVITITGIIAGVLMVLGYSFAAPLIIFVLIWYVFIIMAYRIDRANEKAEQRYSQDDYKEK